MKNPLVRLGVAVMIAVFVGVPADVHGQQASPQAPDPHHSNEGAAVGAGATTPEPSQHMMRMMGEMSAADTKLDELLQAMNAAKGPEKTDAIAALVTALVKEHGAMRGSMAMMSMMAKMAKMDKMGTMGTMCAMGDMAIGKPKP